MRKSEQDRVERTQDPDMFYQYLILFCMSKGVCHFINVVIVKCIKALSEPLLIVKPPGGFPGDSECCEASSSGMLRKFSN